MHLIIISQTMKASIIKVMADYSRVVLQEERKNHFLSVPFSTPLILKQSQSLLLARMSMSSKIHSSTPTTNTSYFDHDPHSQQLITSLAVTDLLEKQENQVFDLQFAANNGIEDRTVVSDLTQIPAQIVSVFDGHGGYRLADYCATHIVELVDAYLSESPQEIKTNPDQCISNALKYAYKTLELDFYKQVYKPLAAMNNRKIKNVGTCALTMIAYKQKIYVANSGDSEAILVSQDGPQVKYRPINQRFSVNQHKERVELIEKFPNDRDIIQQRGGVFYVKGRLQPTRSIGDYYLKYSELFQEKGNFNGPYIKSQPQIQIHKISQNDKTIVLASDGLWDFVQKQKIANLSLQYNPHEQMLAQTLRTIAGVHSLSVEEIKAIDPKQKRNFHDDISIVVVKIGKLMKSSL